MFVGTRPRLNILNIYKCIYIAAGEILGAAVPFASSKCQCDFREGEEVVM